MCKSVLSLLVVLFYFVLIHAETSFAQCRVFWSEPRTGSDSIGGIFQAKADGTGKVNVVPLGEFGNISVDLTNDKVYWYVKDQGIFVEDLNDFGSVSQNSTLAIPFTDGSLPLVDFLIDPVAAKIYWTTTTTLNRADLDSSNQEQLVTEDGVGNLFVGSTLKLDKTNNKIYWATSMAIRRANLDGTNVETIASGPNYAFSRALEIDPANSLIYFADNNDKIRMIGFDGMGDTDFAVNLGVVGALLLDNQGNRLLYSDTTADTIVAIPIAGGDSETIATAARDIISLAFDSSEITSAKIYFSSQTALGRVFTSGGDVQHLEAAFTQVGYFDLSDEGQVIYSSGSGALLSVNLDGSNRQTIISGFGKITGIIGDSPTVKYFADSEQGKIFALRGNRLSELVTGLGDVQGLTVAFFDTSSEAAIFWTENNNGVGSVRRAKFPPRGETSTPEILVDNINLAHGLEYDPRTDRLFWAESGSNARKGGIRSAFTDGSNETVVLELGTGVSFGGRPPTTIITQPQPRGLDVGAGLYLAESATLRDVFRVKRSTGERRRDVDFASSSPVGVRQLSVESDLCGTTKDIDSDSTSEYIVWRESTGIWFANLSNDMSLLSKQWGLPGDQPLSGDYDGDGSRDLSVWRPGNGSWYHCLSSTSYDCSQPRVRQHGLPGDYPIIADMDGDGQDDETVWRPSNGLWYYFSSVTSTLEVIQWGLPGDFPLVGDFDADGIGDLAVWRPSEGNWYLLLSTCVF